MSEIANAPVKVISRKVTKTGLLLLELPDNGLVVLSSEAIKMHQLLGNSIPQAGAMVQVVPSINPATGEQSTSVDKTTAEINHWFELSA
jgi:hypothetical protein